jgi:hypothetical protein
MISHGQTRSAPRRYSLGDSPRSQGPAIHGSRGILTRRTQDERDLTRRKVEGRGVSYDVLQHSDDGDLAERHKGLASASRARAHLMIFRGPLRVCAMSAEDVRGKAHREFDASSEIKAGLSRTNDPQQGARLVRAFLRIADPAVRLAIVHMVEKVGSARALH